jgi:hypothetical protein
LEERVRVDFFLIVFFFVDFFFGTWAPAPRAWASPIAMACFRLVLRHAWTTMRISRT